MVLAVALRPCRVMAAETSQTTKGQRSNILPWPAGPRPRRPAHSRYVRVRGIRTYYIIHTEIRSSSVRSRIMTLH